MLSELEKIIDSVMACDSLSERARSIFAGCYKDVIQKTVRFMDDESVHVITGDIPAMWLRDSACQMLSYFSPARNCGPLASLLVGVSKRQFNLINTDPYANAFNMEADGSCYSKDDTQMGPMVWERKYELDSLCYPIWFSYKLWKEIGVTEQFDDSFLNASEKILEVIRTEQYHEERSEYFFRRSGCRYFDTLSRDGRGTAVKSGIGLVWSGFRPSDDACTFGYNIPSNMLCATVMGELSEIAGMLAALSKGETGKKYLKDAKRIEFIFREARAIETEIGEAIEKYGVADLGDRKVYAYETDGYGQYLVMDDANMPSLLSMKFMGYEPKDMAVYEATRELILSRDNPYYYKGETLEGIGSPHTRAGYAWPIALAVQGLTDERGEKKRQLIEMIAGSDADTGCIHESIDVDDPKKYSREWFSWANVMYCLLVMDYCKM